MIARSRSAFTLLEVVLALAIVAALAGAVMGFLLNLLSGRERIALACDRQQGAGALIEHVESDLAGALVGEERTGAGVVGTSSSLALLTRGVWVPASARPLGVSGDLQGAEYVFDEREGVVRARRWAAGEAKGAEEVIASGIELARFRYFDGERWSESFDTLERGQLPVAVELAIWFGTPVVSEEVVETFAEEEEEERGMAFAPADPADPSSRGRVRPEEPSEPEPLAADALPSRDPDRVRLMIVPDGPVTAWMEGRS